MLRNKLVIGIIPTYYFDDTDPYGDNSHFVRMYEDRIKECGAIAVGLLHSNLNIYKDVVDAYLWPGGSIIIKDFYSVFEDVIKSKKPLLGVCLGAQAIATYFNILYDQKLQPNLSLLEVYDSNKFDNLYLKKLDGDSLNLHQNIITKDKESIKKAKHKIKIKENTFMYDIYNNKEIETVSLHSYEIARTPKNIIISAKSKDGIIEAVEYHEDNNHILGLQFHPEVDNDHKPFIWLIENAYKKYSVLVNKDNKIKENNFKYIYHDSKYPKALPDECFLEEQTYYAFISLKEKMREYGFEIDLESGFRTHKSQKQLYDNTMKKEGLEYANKYVAKPYYSEHETGLAVDICCCMEGKWYIENDDHLKEMYKKLHEIIADYGFILRYPKGKEEITGYAYEPWHIRYVANLKVSKEIMNNSITLEEYLNINK